MPPQPWLFDSPLLRKGLAQVNLCAAYKLDDRDLLLRRAGARKPAARSAGWPTGRDGRQERRTPELASAMDPPAST